MPEWIAVIIAGLVGAIAHACLTGGFVKPYRFMDRRGVERNDPGIYGTLFVGAITGFVSWALSNPVASFSAHAEVHGVATALIAGAGGGQVLRGAYSRIQLESSEANTAKVLTTVSDAALSAQEGDSTGT